VVAAIKHLGDFSSSGHYYAYIRHGNDWVRAEDQTLAVEKFPELDRITMLVLQKQ